MKNPCFYECGKENCHCEEEQSDSKKCCSSCCHIRLAIGVAVLLAVAVVAVVRLRK